MRNTRDKIYTILGFFFFLLGIIGAILPIMPTVPFILVAAGFWAKSSQRFYNWLLFHPLFGSYIYQYKIEKIIPIKMKFWTISWTWLCLIISMLVFTKNWIARLLVCAMGLSFTIYILHFSSKRKTKK